MALPTIAQGEPYIYTILVDTNGNPLAAIPTNNPSVGVDGNPIPGSSTLLGGSDGTNLQPLQVDGSKNLKVNLTTPLPAGTAVIGHVIVDSGTETIAQGAGASQGTSWRVKGDSAELSGLSANTLNALLVPKTDVSQYKSFSLQLSGTYNANITIEGSNDGTTFYSFPIEDNSGDIITNGGSGFNGLFKGPCCYRYLQVRVSSYVSGTINAVFELYTFPVSPYIVIAQQGTDYRRDPWTFNLTQIGGASLAEGQAAMANSVPVVIASNQTPLTSSTGTKSNVVSSASSVTILASNANRKGAVIYNDSTQILYLDLSGGTASSTSYSVQVGAQGYFELPPQPIYTGAITGIWASANGNARVTEFS